MPAAFTFLLTAGSVFFFALLVLGVLQRAFEQLRKRVLAQESGTLTLLLRNPADLDYQEKRNILDAKMLLAGDRTGELQQKRYKTIQIIRGNKSSSNETAGVAAAKPE